MTHTKSSLQVNSLIDKQSSLYIDPIDGRDDSEGEIGGDKKREREGEMRNNTGTKNNHAVEKYASCNFLL